MTDAEAPALTEKTPRPTNKSCSQRILLDHKRIFIERSLAEPIPRKPRVRRRSPIYRKCEDLMEELWNEGYRKQISCHILRHFIMLVCGGFRTTVNDYLGTRNKYYRSRGRRGVLKKKGRPGYLERFGFIEKVKGSRAPLVNLHHERVDRSYHHMQINIVSFSLSKDAEANERIEGATAPTANYYTTTTYKKRERNRLSESILLPEEERILNLAEDPGR